MPRTVAQPPRVSEQLLTTQARTSHTVVPQRPVNTPGFRARAIRRLLLSALLAGGAGIVVAAAGQFRYNATGKFTVPAKADHCRREFLDFLWQRQEKGEISLGWSVEIAPQDQTIDVVINEKTPESAKAAILRLAKGLEDFLETREQLAIDEDQQTNVILENLISELNSEAEQHSTVLSADNTPTDDPISIQNRLRATIADRIVELNQLRAVERSDAERLTRLRTSSTDDKPLVTENDRDSAFAQRRDLSQDIQQLDVQLHQARRFLENVWQATSPHMDHLLSAAAACVQSTTQVAGNKSTTPATRYTTSASLYQQRLSRFTRRWTASFIRLRDTPVDIDEPALFEAHDKLRDLLGDFLYHSGKLLDSMHDDTRQLTESASTQTHQQRLVSDIRRSFHRLESAHRQLEFAASDIRRRNNFRLDSALKSARGLLRRVHDEKAVIEAELQQIAREKWTRQRESEQSSLVAHLAELRERINQGLDEMIELQDKLVRTMPKIEQHLRKGLAAETAQSRIAQINRRLIDREKTLEELRQRSEIRRLLYRSQLVKTEVDTVPANIRERVLFGLGAAIATFATCLALTSRLRFAG